MTFYLIAFIFCLLAVIYISPALLSRRSIRLDDSVKQNALIANQRLNELDKHAIAGDTTTQIGTDEKLEIETALATDIAGIKSVYYRKIPFFYSAIWVVVFLSISAFTYSYLGSPHLLDSHPGISTAENTTPDIGILIQQLETRLAEEPDNPRGWELAGRTYMSMGSYEKAEHAYSRLNALESGNADFLAALADASIMANGNSYTPTAQAAISQALQLNPRHINSLWIAGLGTGSLGDNQEAIDYFEKLKPLLAGDEEALLNLEQLIAENRSRLANQPEATPVEQTTSGKIIKVEVSLANSIQNRINGDEMVFVIARARTGPAAPLAVQKFSVQELPKSVSLTAEMAMISGMDIDSFHEIEVLSRVSKTGEPRARNGDFQSDVKLLIGSETDQPVLLDIAFPVEVVKEN